MNRKKCTEWYGNYGEWSLAGYGNRIYKEKGESFPGCIYTRNPTPVANPGS